MNEQERFNQLWSDYLEGDLDGGGLEELRELMAGDDLRLPEAVNDFQIHRLLGLDAQDSDDRHEAFVRETMGKLPLPQDDFVGQVMSGVLISDDSRIIRWIPNWALSAVAAVAIMASILFLGDQRPSMIATISNMSGPALWTGDAGRVIRDLKTGMPLPGGTLEDFTQVMGGIDLQ